MARRKKAETDASFQRVVARVYGIQRTRADGDGEFIGWSLYEETEDSPKLFFAEKRGGET